MRGVLSPFSAVYGGMIARINAAYDRDPPRPGPIPALSIGNLTVGGTGKTPVSAYFARRLRDAGATPAIVMRGYGGDEVLVHRLLNPDIDVIARIDRVDGVQEAARHGADIAIFDDALQHRRVARVADVVLVSADTWTGTVRLLPSGPFREPLSALSRADVVLVTVKAAEPDRIRAAVRAVRDATDSAVVTVDLAAASFVDGAGTSADIDVFRQRRILAVSGIGNPTAFHAQLAAAGAIVEPMVYADHHAFSAEDVVRIVQRSAGCDAVVCTLKDAVKLGSRWPGSAVPLWYLSQSVVPRDDAGQLDALIQSMLDARRNGRT
jgi:tetraacyldisaccharide 4'-kinase